MLIPNGAQIGRLFVKFHSGASAVIVTYLRALDSAGRHAGAFPVDRMRASLADERSRGSIGAVILFDGGRLPAYRTIRSILCRDCMPVADSAVLAELRSAHRCQHCGRQCGGDNA